MTATLLLRNLRLRCVTLWTDGSRLRWKPRNAVTPSEVFDLMRHKAAIIALLTANPVRDWLTTDVQNHNTCTPPKPDSAAVEWLRAFIADGHADRLPGFQLRQAEYVSDPGKFARSLLADLTGPTTPSRRRLAMEDLNTLKGVAAWPYK